MKDEFIFVQLVEANGYEVVNEHIRSCTYIETGDIGGVKLILSLYDHKSIYSDNVGIKVNTEIKVTFGDPDGRGDAGWSNKFIVKVPSVESGILTLECFEKNSEDLKAPAPKPIFLNEMQPAAILKKLCPNLKVICDRFLVAGTYHLNPGGTKSRLIRNMARDYGAMCFIARGAIYFLDITKMTNTPDFTLEWGNPNADISIARYQKLGEDDLHERVYDRRYIAWDTVDGMVTSNKHTDKANALISVPNRQALDKQHVSLMPILEVEMLGNGNLTPSPCVKVIFHKQLPETELDESIPTIQYISQVAHHQEGMSYVCKLELSVKHE